MYKMSKSCKTRTQNAINFRDKIAESSRNGKDIFFFDEYNFNQLKEEDNSYLSPMGVTVYKKKHYTARTSSVTLLLIVSSKHQIIYYKLYGASEGGTDFNRVTDFLVEASKKMPEGKKYLYLDNAPCHARAFGAKNTHSKAAKLKKSFD